MKLSVSMPADDVDFLDAYAEEHALGSRSAAMQHAIRLLRTSELAGSYGDAWIEWDGADGALWDATAADGL